MKMVKKMMKVNGECDKVVTVGHLEVADNATSGEPCHLNGHILCLLSNVPLAEISFVLKHHNE